MLLWAVCLAAMAMPLSFAGPAVALTSIREALGGGPVALSWVTNAFMLSFGGGLMAAGALADAHGRKRVFMAGVLLFALASAAWGLARGIVGFDVLRLLQGFGASAALAAGSAAMAQAFNGQGRTRAFSLMGTSFGVGLAFGPLLAGGLIETFGWLAYGWLLAGVGALSATIAWVGMAESRDPTAQGLDVPGAASFTAALGLFTFAVLQAPDWGWGNGWILAALGSSVLLLGMFCAVELGAARPMLDLTLFRFPRFIGVQCLAAAPAYAYVVLLVLLPLRFIGIEGLGAAEAGRTMIALSLPMLVVPSLAAWLTRWVGAATLCSVGLLVCAAGLWWLAGCAPGSSAAVLLGPLLLIGAGIGLPWGLMDGLAVSVVPPERAGMAAGIFGTVRVAGEGVALAFVGSALMLLVERTLAGSVPIGTPAGALASAAQLLATGNLAGALQFLPGAVSTEVVGAYGRAFTQLLHGLAAITLVTAAVVFGLLRGGGSGKRRKH